MSDKVFVGRRCATVSKPPALKPISKIVLWVDSENCYEAGDNSGREHEVTCPYGTQKMANDLLRKLGGYVYKPLEATDALIDPAAELGDAVTVAGRQTILASMSLNFDGLLTADISAPGAAELKPEYTFTGAEKLLNRKIARTNSRISKTSEEIRLEVSGLDDKYTALSVTLDGVTISDSTGKTLIKGSSIDTSTIKANSITADKLNLTGAISFGDLDAQTQIKITNAYDMALNNQLPSYIKSTYIDRVSIQSPTIVAGTFIGNEFNVLSESSGGSFNLYGKYGNASIKALEISYSSGDAPVVYFGGTIARFNFGAAYFDCGIDIGQYDLSFNYGGYITSVRDLAARVAALEAK